MEAVIQRSRHAGKPPTLFPALLNLCSRLPQSQKGGAFDLASQLYAAAAKRGPLPATASNSLHSARPDLALTHLRCSASTPRDPFTYNALLNHLPPTAYSSSCFRPNVATLLALLRASHALPPRHGLVVHAYLLKTAYIHTRNTVPNSLLAMYAAFGDPLAVAKVFDEMPLRDVISWTSMIGACLAAGGAPHALRLFSQMLVDATLEVDGVVLVVSLRACSSTSECGPERGGGTRRRAERRRRHQEEAAPEREGATPGGGGTTRRQAEQRQRHQEEAALEREGAAPGGGRLSGGGSGTRRKQRQREGAAPRGGG